MAHNLYSMNIYEQMREEIPASASLGLTVLTLDFFFFKRAFILFSAIYLAPRRILGTYIMDVQLKKN